MVSEQMAAPERGDGEQQRARDVALDVHWELALEHRRRLRSRQREREQRRFGGVEPGPAPAGGVPAEGG